MLTLTEQLISELDKSQTMKAAMGSLDGGDDDDDDETCSTLTMSISHRSRSSMLGTSLHSETTDPPPLMSYSAHASPSTSSRNRRRRNTLQQRQRQSSIQHIMDTQFEQSFHHDDSGAANNNNNNNNMDASSSRINGSSSRRATMMNFRTNSFLRRHGVAGDHGMEASLSSLNFGNDEMDQTSRRNNSGRRTTATSSASSRQQQRRASIQCTSQPSRSTVTSSPDDRMCASYHSTLGGRRSIRRGSSFDPKMGTSYVHFERQPVMEVSSRDENDEGEEDNDDTLEDEMSARFGMGSSFHHASTRRNTFQPFLESSFDLENSFAVAEETENIQTREGDLDYLDLSIRPCNLKNKKRGAADGLHDSSCLMRQRPSLNFCSLIGEVKKTVQEEKKEGWTNFWSNRVHTFQQNMDTIFRR